MPLHIIVDGYNLIRQSPEMSALDRMNLQSGREALLDKLAAYKRIKGHPITVVFDGSGSTSFDSGSDAAGGIEIRFSRGGESADEVIKRLAARKREKALVVSSDRDIAAFCASHGAAVIPSPQFEAKLADALLLESGSISPEPEDDDPGWLPTTRKKGPSRRLPRKKRQDHLKIGKL